METFSALLALWAANSPVPGEFPVKRPVTRSFDVFLKLRLNRQLNKQSWGWWFETRSRSLWRHCNDGSEFDPRLVHDNLSVPPWVMCILPVPEYQNFNQQICISICMYVPMHRPTHTRMRAGVYLPTYLSIYWLETVKGMSMEYEKTEYTE